MAQDAGQDDALDMVTVFRSSAHDAEMEAGNVHALLEAGGVSSILVGPSVLPVVEFQVQVERERLEEAQKLIHEAEESGPDAAAEAEAEGEK
jgi:rubrerythrin